MNHRTNLKGFTIVELLIVIVVIAILAAISIVAYTGIQSRARTSSAQTAASNSMKKVNIYYAEQSSYPATFATLTGAASTETYKLDGVTFAGSISAAPAAPATVIYQRCGVRASGTTTAPTELSQIITTTGAKTGYWNYQTNATVFFDAGTVSGLVGTQNVACYSTAT